MFSSTWLGRVIRECEGAYETRASRWQSPTTHAAMGLDCTRVRLLFNTCAYCTYCMYTGPIQRHTLNASLSLAGQLVIIKG
jgi:hypothetical protein